MSQLNHKFLPTPRTRVLPVWKLKDMIKRGEIVMDAPYQRGVVWETEKMSELIDSILNNFYIPPLLFAVRRIRGKDIRMVIDGKQRLTSARRFMRNLIPFTDNSTGIPLDRYYCSEPDDEQDNEFEAGIRAKKTPTNFLTPDLFDKFNSYEFVCVEYTGITEDDEYDIFSRVQLGKAITSAEKLRAHNTSVANTCRQFAEDYKMLTVLFARKGSADLFQMISYIMFVLCNESKKVRGGVKQLTDFVSDQKIKPSTDKLILTKKVLEILKKITEDDELKQMLTKHENKTCHVKGLELLIFTTYISLVQRTRHVGLYASDFKSLRRFLYERREGRFYVGQEAFAEGMEWVDSQLDANNLRSVFQQAMITGVNENENNESIHDDYEPGTSNKRATKRRRQERNEALPVARRGGKIPPRVQRH